MFTLLIASLPLFPKDFPVNIPTPMAIFGPIDKPKKSPLDFDREGRRKKRKKRK